MPNSREIIIIAGPNGAGKTTFAREYLPQEAACLNFINADLIAAGLAPFKPESAAIQAGRLMLQEIDRYVQYHECFAFETTLSRRSYARQIPLWGRTGHVVDLIYLTLPSPEMALDRVAARVAQGGHDIPKEVVRRRFQQGWQNLELIYRKLVNRWEVYDNSESAPILLAKGTKT